MKNYVLAIVLTLVAIFSGAIGNSSVIAKAENNEKGLTVSKGSTVSIDYTIKLENNNVIDTTEGVGPLSYTHGTNELVPGLEKELGGMTIGQSKHIVVTPENGYGPIIPEAFIEVKKDKVPNKGLKIGSRLEAKDPEGRIVYSTIKEIRENTVLLDFNHPLAGKTLYIDVEVMDIKPKANQ